MNRIALDLGFIQIYWYSIIILLGMTVGLIIAYRKIKQEKIDEEFFFNLVFYTIVFAIVGSRLYYVAFNLDYYLNYPIEILEVWNGGLAIHGGILFGFLFILYYTKKKGFNLLRVLDIVSPALLIGQAIGRWGNFFNGEAHGGIVSLSFLQNLHLPKFIINGMYINGEYYHPTFLYESLWNIIGFIVIIIFRRYKKFKIGQITGFYLSWYSFARFFIEGLRTDSLMLGDIKIAQLVSIILFIIGIIIMIMCRKEKRTNKRIKEETHE